MDISSANSTFPGCERKFATTRWSIVYAAGNEESPQSRAALERLCQIYWYPLYAYARRRGNNSPDAQDITQGFFAELITKNRLAGVQHVSRFRAYLLTAFKHFLSNENDRARTQKRGGGVQVFSLDPTDADLRYTVEPVCDTTPEKLFERGWALALLEQALARVENEYHFAGKRALFEALKPGLTGASVAHAKIAVRLKVSEGAVKVAAHRLRQRYRDVFRAEIAETVVYPDEIDDEMRHLRNALSK